MVLQPEEWVRQHCIKFLTNKKKYPKTLISVERKVIVNGQKKGMILLYLGQTGRSFVLLSVRLMTSRLIKKPLTKVQDIT